MGKANFTIQLETVIMGTPAKNVTVTVDGTGAKMMSRVYSDAERLIAAAKLERNGHHGKAAAEYQRMGNEYRNPNQKKELWKMAENARKNRDA
jgi:hypothetical protein